MNEEYSVNDLFDRGSPNYNGAVSFNTPPPSAQKLGLDGVSPATLSAGELQENTTLADGYLQSSNYVAATTGWQLTPTSGDINFTLSVQQIILGTSGYIRGGQTDYDTGTGFFLGYSGAAYKFSVGSSTGTKITWDGTALTVRGNQAVSKIMTAGEALSDADAVYIATAGTDSTITHSTDNSTQALSSTSHRRGQTYPVGANAHGMVSCTFKLSLSGTPTGNLSAKLYETSAGLPTTLVATSTSSKDVATLTGTATDTVFTFDPDVAAVDPSGTYAVILDGSTLNYASGSITIQSDSAGGYANGDAVSSNDGGSTWSKIGGAGATDLTFAVSIEATVAGRVYKTKATTATETNTWFGFADGAASKAGNAPIIVGGIPDGFSGLTPSTTYYVSNTAAGISSSAGTISRKVGFALTATELLIISDNL